MGAAIKLPAGGTHRGSAPVRITSVHGSNQLPAVDPGGRRTWRVRVDESGEPALVARILENGEFGAPVDL